MTCKNLSQRVHSCRSADMLAWAIEVFSAAHLAAIVLERGICRGRTRPQASIDVYEARWDKQSLKQYPRGQAGLRRPATR